MLPRDLTTRFEWASLVARSQPVVILPLERAAPTCWKGTDGQAPNLLGLVRSAGEAPSGAHTRPRRHRTRRALDDILQSRDNHAGALTRAHPRSGFCCVGFRSGRLDQHGLGLVCCRNRSGIAARQRRLRSGPLRRSSRNAPNLHPPCQRCQASKRSPRPHLHTVWRGGDGRGDEGGHSEASEGDRERRPRRPHRGPVVAVLPDGAQHAGAVCREPLTDLARPLWFAGDRWSLVAGEWRSLRQVLG